MSSYAISLINKARHLRSEGKTYQEIRKILDLEIPKSTLSSWFKDITLPKDYPSKIIKLNIENLIRARLIAKKARNVKRQQFLETIREINLPVSHLIHDPKTAKIALAMLCLGEARKYNHGGSFYLGSSDSRIIIIFLALLKICFKFNIEKVRCTVQCRADQNIKLLEEYWLNATGIPKRLFYKARIDPRTIGKPTLKKEYKGVLRVEYFDTKVQLELESLSSLVYNQLLLLRGPVA